MLISYLKSMSDSSNTLTSVGSITPSHARSRFSVFLETSRSGAVHGRMVEKQDGVSLQAGSSGAGHHGQSGAQLKLSSSAVLVKSTLPAHTPSVPPQPWEIA